MLTMQSALLALTDYWTDTGCMIMQPMNTEVGAGTANPATFLRVLGPEPWRAAYVEPSVRPDDSRFGENPNRLQMHTQFQVILKPEPGNAQELYLGSLRALGVDPGAHDIRFVEDNWAQPAIGAWGLGWEVWLDGLEITQFTYFQQVGGQSLDPVPVELTYGVERILMALQGATHVKDLEYSNGTSYGEIFGPAEYEMSSYYLDVADIEMNSSLFDMYAAEADRLVEQGLPVPAYSYVLKCSHTFNVLDARGAISTTERAKAFARMRRLARDVAKLWIARREELHHPLGVATVTEDHAGADDEPLLEAGHQVELHGTAPLLFEIGTEELPPHEVTATIAAVRDAVTAKLADTRLPHGAVQVDGTPRRIVVTVDDVGPREPDAERVVKGPKVSVAFDDDGQPSKALQGFARGQGVAPDTLTSAEVNGVAHVVNLVSDPGRGAVEVLSSLLADVVVELRSTRNMRWNDGSLSFSRPIRWLTALLGEVVVPVSVSTLSAGRTTHVHRTADLPVVPVPSAQDYRTFLGKHGIVVDAGDRRLMIVAAAESLASEVQGVVDVDGEADLIDEITNLVEEPIAILGGFDRKYLELPSAVLTTVMRKHQRYLPVRLPQTDVGGNGALSPFFVTVANGACDRDLVRAGNEAVLTARYEDAAFFWRADLEIAPEEFRRNLEKLTFEERLGSMDARATRIADLAAGLAAVGGLSGDDAQAVQRAGELAKFDLATHMVVELSSLAGVMAKEYATRAGEPLSVAGALYEMELPRHASDDVPSTAPGAVLALADRFDLLMGMFAIGAKPTGSSDPFGMRRAALGVVNILRSAPGAALGVTVSAGLEAAAERLRAQGVEVAPEAESAARDFIVGRFAQQLRDEDVAPELVSAVLPHATAAGADSPSLAVRTIDQLTQLAADEAFADLVTAVQRTERIVPADTPTSRDPELLVEPAERRLIAAIDELGDWSDRDFAEFVDVARSTLVDPVNEFFDAILVMADDDKVRTARLGLLAAILDLLPRSVKWSEITPA
jgi:glycyl-tRNA synthetase